MTTLDALLASGKRRLRLRRSGYYSALAELHRIRRPRTYLEIGVRHGTAIALAAEGTLSIGVDPNPMVPEPIARRCHIARMTSDAFFSSTCPVDLLGERKIDMTFIDGMHLFEFALRDFINSEALSGRDSLIVLHDCIPRDEASSARDRTTGFWTGDVWKLVLCLVDNRADLQIRLLKASPSGLCLVSGLRPGDTTLRDSYSALVEKYVPMGFSEWKARWPETRRLLAAGASVAGSPHRS